MAESEELKSLLMEMKEESKKVDLSFFKLNIQKTKIMASGPITSWQIDGETMETVTDFIFGGTAKLLQMVTAAMKLKDICSLEEMLRPISVQFSGSVMSNPLQPHGLQHTRLPCPSPSLGACSNSCPLSR